jgi:short-subunit dehydrogenase
MAMTQYKSALITGASAGIGAALATALAAPGTVLHLSARDLNRLEATAAACRAKGATVFPRAIDVRDAAAMADWIAAAAPLDLAVANAGIAASGDPNATRDIFATNLDGALNTMLPAMAAMRAQPPGADGLRGRIAVIASIAAFLAMPESPAYSASKAAIDNWTVASARSARKAGVQLTSVCPGFIRTAMTAKNTAPMPGLMTADQAAGIILRGIAAGRVRLAFPWWIATIARLAGLLPPRVLGKLLPDPTGGHS